MVICYLKHIPVGMDHHNLCKNVPGVPEPRNLNERKLVRGKERRKKGGKKQRNFLSFLNFSFYYFVALVPRVAQTMTK